SALLLVWGWDHGGHSCLSSSCNAGSMGGCGKACQFAIKPEHRQLGQVRRDHQLLQAEGILPCGQKFLQASEEHLKQCNIDLKDHPLFPELEKCMNSGPVVIGRVMLGETDPAESKSSTVRRDCCVQVGRNIIHSSDSVKKC
uniref:nucleoside-diphosphate kinase n=1 Tax=Phocoena sinus TaxID=42100 RepID=A0A8C9E1C2_PHOSS